MSIASTEGTETGSLITVYVSRAGGTLAGDHPAGSSELAVSMGWEFNATGGSLSVAGTVYDYTSAVIEGDPLPDLPADPDDEEEPDPNDGWDEQTGEDVDVDDWDVTENDDRPTIVTLTSPLDDDAADGDLVALEPESITKRAEVQLADFDEPIVARIPHHLMDKIAEGSRGDQQDAETVAVYLDGTTWVVDDVMGQPVRTDPSSLDPSGPLLPAPIVPGIEGEPDPDNEDNPEGSLTWTGSYYVERMRSGHLQADVGVVGNFWVARYEDESDPESGPAENSAVIEQNPDNGFVVWSPKLDAVTGQWLYERSDPDNPDSELVQVRDRSVHFPAAQYEQDPVTGQWQRTSAKFAGAVDAEHVNVDGELEINGAAGLSPNTTLQLDNAVNDPTDTPTVTFAPKLRSFPSGAAFEEIGLGRYYSTRVVCGRAAKAPGGDFYNLRARYVDLATGRFEFDSEYSFPFFRVGGFVQVGTRNYVLCKFANHASPWTIVELGQGMGQLTGRNVNVDHLMQDGLNAGCLGDAGRDDTVAFAYRDNQNRVGIRYYNLNLANNPNIPGRDTGYVTTRPLRGVPGVGVVAAGNWIFTFDGADINMTTSWESGAGQIYGTVYMPGTGYLTIHNNGKLAVHNDEITTPTSTDFAYTRVRTNVNPIRQTRMSARARATWPVRKFATVQAPNPVPGTNDTYLYAGAAPATRENLRRLAKTAGQPSTTIARIPTTGSVPPATSGFSSATESPARIISQGTIPGTTRPAALVDAAGNAELYGLQQASVRHRHLAGTTIQSGNPGVIIGWDTADKTSIDIPYAGGTWTVQLAGTYLITAQLSWVAAPSTQGYRQISILVNGATSASGMSGGATNVTACSVTAMPQLNRNDTVQIRTIQNSGNALALRTVGTENYVSILRIGA